METVFLDEPVLQRLVGAFDATLGLLAQIRSRLSSSSAQVNCVLRSSAAPTRIRQRPLPLRPHQAVSGQHLLLTSRAKSADEP